MRVVVTGASGNVGTSVLRSLADEAAVDSILGIARRLPETNFPKTEWATADVGRDDLRPLLSGADAVIHLAWLIQPSRDEPAMYEANVTGSRNVFRAAADAGVGAIVYASSVGTYAPGPKDRRVDESWPATGIDSSYYARHKAEVERDLDAFEREHPDVRVARLRPALIFKREAAAEIRRLFIGPFFPNPLARPGLIPVVPRTRRLVFQAVHSSDVGEAYRLATVTDARGAFNIAAEPELDPAGLGRLLNARPVPLPAPVLRAGASVTWRLRLQPTAPGWVDMALAVPLMSSDRARSELGWRPAHSSGEALLDLLEGLRRGDGLDTPPLAPNAGGPLRFRELVTGVGSR